MTDFLSRAIAAIQRQLARDTGSGLVTVTASEAAALLSAVRQEPPHDPAPAANTP